MISYFDTWMAKNTRCRKLSIFYNRLNNIWLSLVASPCQIRGHGEGTRCAVFLRTPEPLRGISIGREKGEIDEMSQGYFNKESVYPPDPSTNEPLVSFLRSEEHSTIVKTLPCPYSSGQWGNTAPYRRANTRLPMRSFGSFLSFFFSSRYCDQGKSTSYGCYGEPDKRPCSVPYLPFSFACYYIEQELQKEATIPGLYMD